MPLSDHLGRGRAWPARIARAVIVAAGLAWALLEALSTAVDLPTQHLDGAFQTASGLYRLHAGQWPGRDFFPYLGIGPLFTLWPTFAAGGADLAASVVAAHWTTQLAGIGAVALIWQLLMRPPAPGTSLSAGVLLFIGPQVLAPALGLSLPAWFDWALTPGNSLRPLRAALPYMLAGGFLAVGRFGGPGRAALRSVLWGLLAGAGLLWSNDFALVSVALFAAPIAVACWHDRDRGVRRLGLYVGTALLSGLLLLWLATRGHALALLRYNMVDVAGDQWWMFAPYEPSARVFGVADLPRLLSPATLAALALVAALAAVARWRRSTALALLAFIGAALFAGGAVASVGGHLGDYFGGLHYWAAMTLLVGALRGLQHVGRPLVLQLAPPVPALLVAAACAVSVAAAMMAGHGHARRLEAARQDPARFFVPELGGYLGIAWRDEVTWVRRNDAARVIEEYWGLWSALRRSASGWPVDAVIHALGSTRVVATQAMQQADAIVSTRHATSSVWQPWSLSQNYWFHQELLDHWMPERLTPTTIVWRRRDRRLPPEPVRCAPASSGAPGVIVQIDVPGLHELRVRYRLGGGGRALLLVQNRLSTATDGWVSVDPRAGRAVLPMAATTVGRLTLPLRLLGRPTAALQVLGCEARRMPPAIDEAVRLPAEGDDPFYLSDQNWDRGVARHWPGFFVPNTPAYATRFSVGREVVFANGEQRRIERTVAHGAYLHVVVDGGPLRASETGVPSRFSVRGSPASTPNAG